MAGDTKDAFPSDILSSTRLDEEEGVELSLVASAPSRTLTERSGWSAMVILTATVTTLGCSIPLGYGLGVINTPAQIISDFSNTSLFDHYDVILTKPELNILWSTIVSVLIVGAVVGSLSGGWLADRFGRKGAVAINNVLGLVAAILFITAFYANSVEMLLLGRLIAGAAAGLTTSTVPMYLTEIASVNTRGALGGLTSMGLTMGIVLGQVLGMSTVLGRDTTWHLLLACHAGPTLLAAMLLPCLPESPKYLYVVRAREQKAIDELSRLRGLSAQHLSEEMDQLNASSVAKKRTGTFSVVQVLRSSSLRLPLLLVCALQAGQQFSGINAVFYYSMTIFEKCGLSQETSEYATLGAGGVNFAMAGAALVIINQFGRRPLVLLSGLMSAVSLIVLTLSIVCIESASWMPYVCIASVLSYVLWYSIGLGPISFFLGSELFAEGPRPAVMALGSVAMWSSNFLVGMTFPSLQDLVGGYAFLPYAASTLLLCAFLYFYLPETRNRDPQQIAESFNRKKRPLDLKSPTGREEYRSLKDGSDPATNGFSIQFSDTGSAILTQ